jgi:hypothetical protein
MKFEGLGHGLSADLLAAANAIVLESGDYKKFFQSALKKFGVTSPAELKGDKEKEFYDYIDKNWKGKDEKKEAIEVTLPETVEIEETETFIEKAGKYGKYSDLLMQKAKLVAQGPIATKEVGDINKKIQAEIKKLGIKEDKGFEKILMSAFGDIVEDSLYEASVRASFESDEMKNVGGDKAAKKMGVKISFKKGKGNGRQGSDAGIFTGSEKDLVKYFQKYMGFTGKTFKDLQKDFKESVEEKARPSKKFIKLGDEKKNVNEGSRDYYKEADALIAKHGEEKAFVYKAPNLNKIVKDLQNLIKKEVKAGFKGSKKDGEAVIKQLQKLEVMGYDENIVMTNKQHSNFKFNGDTAFREEMAEIIMQDVILSYAIFGE